MGSVPLLPSSSWSSYSVRSSSPYRHVRSAAYRMTDRFGNPHTYPCCVSPHPSRPSSHSPAGWRCWSARSSSPHTGSHAPSWTYQAGCPSYHLSQTDGSAGNHPWTSYNIFHLHPCSSWSRTDTYPYRSPVCWWSGSAHPFSDKPPGSHSGSWRWSHLWNAPQPLSPVSSPTPCKSPDDRRTANSKASHTARCPG